VGSRQACKSAGDMSLSWMMCTNASAASIYGVGWCVCVCVCVCVLRMAFVRVCMCMCFL